MGRAADAGTVPREEAQGARKALTRAERVESHRPQFMPMDDTGLQQFLDFVLAQYVSQGVGELDREKLGGLLELKYQTVSDAADQLGGIPAIRDAFVGFPRHLYEPEAERKA